MGWNWNRDDEMQYPGPNIFIALQRVHVVIFPRFHCDVETYKEETSNMNCVTLVYKSAVIAIGSRTNSLNNCVVEMYTISGCGYFDISHAQSYTQSNTPR